MGVDLITAATIRRSVGGTPPAGAGSSMKRDMPEAQPGAGTSSRPASSSRPAEPTGVPSSGSAPVMPTPPLSRAGSGTIQVRPCVHGRTPHCMPSSSAHQPLPPACSGIRLAYSRERAHTHTHIHTHTHARTHARRTHTRTHTHAHAVGTTDAQRLASPEKDAGSSLGHRRCGWRRCRCRGCAGRGGRPAGPESAGAAAALGEAG
jgi:hypothetical protein